MIFELKLNLHLNCVCCCRGRWPIGLWKECSIRHNTCWCCCTKNSRNIIESIEAWWQIDMSSRSTIWSAILTTGSFKLSYLKKKKLKSAFLTFLLKMCFFYYSWTFQIKLDPFIFLVWQRWTGCSEWNKADVSGLRTVDGSKRHPMTPTLLYNPLNSFNVCSSLIYYFSFYLCLMKMLLKTRFYFKTSDFHQFTELIAVSIESTASKAFNYIFMCISLDLLSRFLKYIKNFVLSTFKISVQIFNNAWIFVKVSHIFISLLLLICISLV